MSLYGFSPTIRAVLRHRGKEITKLSMLNTVVNPLESPSLNSERRPASAKSAINERESRSVTEAGFCVLMKRLLRVATPTPPIELCQECPP